MSCEIEYTDQFEDWWDNLDEEEQESVYAIVNVLEEHGTNLKHPYSTSVESSKHSHMRELRIQHQGSPYRVLYAFDPRRNAILLIGGNKRGNKRWYNTFVPIADKLYKEHLKELSKEEKENG